MTLQPDITFCIRRWDGVCPVCGHGMSAKSEAVLDAAILDHHDYAQHVVVKL